MQSVPETKAEHSLRWTRGARCAAARPAGAASGTLTPESEAAVDGGGGGGGCEGGGTRARDGRGRQHSCDDCRRFVLTLAVTGLPEWSRGWKGVVPGLRKKMARRMVE